MAGIAAVLVASGVAACGGEPVRVGDAKIIKRLNLEKLDGENSYAIDGDLFCSVEKELLNTREEVEAARESSDLVVTSNKGNIGVVGVPVFAKDCRKAARKGLNKLDPSD